MDVDLALPLPPRLRVYLYNLVESSSVKRNFEYKAVLRVPDHPVGEYRSFDHTEGRITLLAAYRKDIDVFVLWDASLHSQFKNGGNIQVRDATVLMAAAVGSADQTRSLSSGTMETVIVCQSWNLTRAIERRINSIGGAPEERWATSQS